MVRKIGVLCCLLANIAFAQIFHTDDFSTPSGWTLNSTPASLSPAQGANDPAFNPWVINALNFFTPSGPISGNSLKITIQPGTDFDGLGLSANYSGYDPFNVSERNITDAVALMNTNINASGRFGITLEFDYQTGGWLGDDYGTVVFSADGGVSWTEIGSGTTVSYTNINMNNMTLFGTGSAPAAPPNPTTQNAFSNIDGFSSGALWHRASVALPASCDNNPNLRIGFRWRNIDHLSNSPDYLGVSFNVDNIALRVDPPTADFNWVPLAVCTGQNVTFDPSASDPGGGASITGWIWTFSGGTPSTSNLQNPVVTWPSAGMDTVTLQVVNNLGDTSLVSSQYIFINDCQPEAEFLVNPTVCADSNLIFADLSANMGAAFAPTTWSWTFTGGSPASASGQGPHSVSFSSTGPHSITLTTTNAYGSDDTTVTVNVVDCSCGALTTGGTFWSEDFDGNSGMGSRWVTSPLNQAIGAQGTTDNQWYISDQENGNPVGACGAAGGGNQTLHMSANPSTVGDIGAAYEVGCAPGCFFCDFFAVCIFSATDKRSQSQNINTTGQSGLTLEFDYMEGGEGTDDNATVEYSTDGGSTWNFLADPAKTALGCSPQGTWTAFSMALPAACDNIPNLRIAFRWRNDEDGTGSDPSFAVDDVRISTSGPATLPYVWEGDVSNDWHVAANWNTNLVPTNADNVLIPTASVLTSLCPGCVMPEIFNGDAEALDVCNYGTITIHDTPTKRTLTVWGALLNEGAITTTSIDVQDDVLFRGTSSTYAGTGTNVDVDYQVMSGQTTLLSDISCRSFKISSDFDWDIFTITVKRNFYRTTGSVTSTATSTLLMDGPGSGIDTNPAQELGSNITLTIPNFIVNKPSGIVTLSTNAIHSISQNMTIYQGIVDAGTGQITGPGTLVMVDGEFWLARTGTTVPQITGAYSLTGGLVRLYGAGAQTLRGARRYYNLEFQGTDVKNLGGNVDVANQLILNQTLGVGNHVNANGNTLHVLNPNPTAVTYSWGHVVGNLRRNILANGTYRFHVGSDAVSTVTYYEPIDIQSVNLLTTNEITVAFNKNSPSPVPLSPVLTEFGATFTTMETEGYWEVNPDAQPTGGTFTVTQYPSPAWIFASVSYTQVRQDAVGNPWGWNGSNRVTALKRRDYPSFSNFGIASSNDALPVAGLLLKGAPDEMGIALEWESLVEVNGGNYVVERSQQGMEFDVLHHQSVRIAPQWLDFEPFEGRNYYRIRQEDPNGAVAYSNTVMVMHGAEFSAMVYPNPAEDWVQVELAGENGESISVRLIEMSGRVFQSWNGEFSGGHFSQRLNLSEVPSGVWMLEIKGRNQRFTEKLIIR